MRWVIKGIRVRYPDFMTLRSIFKGIVNMNLKSSEKCQYESCFLVFNSKSEFSVVLVFQTPLEMSIKWI